MDPLKTAQSRNSETLNNSNSNNSEETTPEDSMNSTSNIANTPSSELEIGDSSFTNTTPKQRTKRKYNFQRASVACEQCRKAKTRCNYINNGSNCFRCENLSLKCSLSDYKHQPVLSKFQKSANLKTRDELDENKSSKRRKGVNPLSDMQPVSVETNQKLNNVNINANRSKNSNVNSNANANPNANANSTLNMNIKGLGAMSNNSLDSANTAALLSLINGKIDLLASNLNSLLNEKKTILLSQDNPNNNNYTNYYNTQRNENTNNLPKLYSNQPTIPTQQPPLSNPPSLPSTFPLMAAPPPLPPNSATTSNQHTAIPPTAYLPSSHPPPTHPSLLPPAITAPLARPYLHSSNRLVPNDYQLPANFTNSNGKIPNQSAVHENDEFFFLNAPYIDVLNLASTVGLPFTREIGFDITKDMILLSIQERYDLINRKILDYDTCYKLIETALLHYGKWISYVENDFKTWFDTIRNSSPLLFCTLVLFGLRHYRSSHNNKTLELDILQSIHQLLSLSIYEVPQAKEFLQTIILLTHFSPSLSYKHIYFDSWWISSYGLVHFMTREMTINLLVKSVKSPEKIHQYRIWNHLTISHLINCILSGRPCIIDEIRLDQCRDILDLPEANSFDAIVVATLCIILSLYNSLQFREDIEISLKELDTVYSDWKYLSDSVTLGSVIIGFYYFAKMMILRRYILKNLSQRGQLHFTKTCKEFSSCSFAVSNFIKSRFDIFGYSDCMKQSLFLCLFMTLQFKQLDLFHEPEDNSIILKFVDNYLEVCSVLENKLFFYNGYYSHYSELITRLRNMVFPNNQIQSTQ